MLSVGEGCGVGVWGVEKRRNQGEGYTTAGRKRTDFQQSRIKRGPVFATTDDEQNDSYGC